MKNSDMKKAMLALLPWLFFGFGYKAIAQEEMNKKEGEKEAEEIIIRKKGLKDANINIRINGDKVTINGKPLVEFKDDEITVNKRKIIVRDGNRMMFGDLDADFENGNFGWDNGEAGSSAFLGVSTEKNADGAIITEEVKKESAAGKAGLEKGDIITKLGDARIDGPQSLYEAVTAKKPNNEVKISYKRKGKDKTTTATLGERKSAFTKSYSYNGPDGSYKTFTMPAIPKTPRIPQPPPDWSAEDYRPYLAPEIQDELNNLEMELGGFPGRKKLGLKIQDTEEGNGVKVLDVEDSSAAAIAGLKKDDVITGIGGEKVSNTDDARERFQKNREKGTYQVKARRNGNEMNFSIRIPKKLKTANL
ncbi:MAG: PDZ domain-containing protein [Ferruginibacter sp.]|nr:PDZ domain-containing protein [Ferruginibacter sp.]